MRQKLSELAYGLCLAIEELPASEQQTAVSVKASELFRRIQELEAAAILRVAQLGTPTPGEVPGAAWRECYRCHTWINDGKAQFLPDSTHSFAGQTVDLIEMP